ncbi:LacI family DNA-binding transcriptional regulator [Nocardioides sp. YIM 152315]|uniref:LacI family DNA-binding transcriptional regulator n=1 Tax=Nocardioides sp. YIM 152315 TaxID=3031760 RepID=UPI0023D996DA|nr:LacI family DNA-binding transcriptional regulator [Nocardioides sp. YIM 152315]MDF1604878.1 LacI family DNA-binding transcriptional regulator [Nocardioides sp. YIM 152315]
MTRPLRSRPTLEEVAARAGVGRGTASRVINGGEKVSERARLAVQQAIDELGYVPNAAARALVTRRTDAIALVIAESEERVFGEPFFAGVIRGIGSALAEADRQLILVLAQASRRRGALDEYLTRQHVDGVLLLSLHDDDELPARIRAHGVPLVVGGRAGAEVDHDFVDVDNVQGARLAVEHLLGLGRRHVATIAGPSDMVAGHSRYEGYADAIAAAGVPVEERLVARGDFGQASGEEAMRALLAGGAVDAVFCANDLMAAGALRALGEAGLKVPEDVAVVGFEDAPIAQSTTPPLTTVHQSPEQMGREMVAVVLAATREPGTPQPGRMLPTHLVVRGSA